MKIQNFNKLTFWQLYKVNITKSPLGRGARRAVWVMFRATPCYSAVNDFLLNSAGQKDKFR